MQFIGILILAVTLFSCVKKEESKSSPSITVTGAGSTNFGKVKIGEYRIAGIQIKNATSSSVSYSISGISSPFTIDGVQGGCSLSSVSAGSTCVIKIRFTPTHSSESFISVSVLGTVINFQGKGLQPGILSLGHNSWSAGVFKAGEQKTLNLPVTNSGDTNLGIPRVATPGFQIIAQSCGTELIPGENCQLVVAVQKAQAQEYIEPIQFYTLDSSDFYNLDFTGDVRPASASGSIEFQSGDTQIIADNTSTTMVTTMSIRDPFGNVVSDGETCVATPVNINIVGSTSSTTLNGVVSFNLRATGTTGPSRLVISCNLASGVYNLSSVSGPPTGTINLRPYLADIRANGISTLTLETTPLLNISGNVVTDGTPIEVILDGPGTIVTSELYTINGVLRVQIRSTITSGLGKITLRANPSLDGNGDITGYQAWGEFPINFIPLDEIGNFSITSDDPSIYFTQPGGARLDQTNVRITDIRDENNNPVGAGFTANINISNGKHAVSNMSSFSISTDALSSMVFPVKGSGLRDWITVDVTINGTSRSHRIFAVGEQELQHNRGTTNRITLKQLRSDSRFNVFSMTPDSTEWKDVELDYYSIRSQDNSNFGFKKTFGKWQEITGPLRHLIWDCMIPVQSFLGTPPCGEKKTSVGGLVEYRSYSIHETKTERTPETFINANVPVLPHMNAAFGNYILGPISAYDPLQNKYHIFGGVEPVETQILVGSDYVTRFGFSAVNSSITYGDVTLMAYTPFAHTSYTKELSFQIAPSYYRYRDTIYIYGGLKRQGPGIIAGNIVQVFKDGDLDDLIIDPGLDGSPVGRYQNGVYFEDSTNELFVFGGRNANGDFLDEIWKSNLNDVPKTWVKVCNLCGIPNNTVDNIPAIVSMMTTPVDMPTWQNIFEPMRPPVVFKDTATNKTYYTMPYNTILAEINLNTGHVDENVTEDELQQFRNYGHLIQHHRMDRFYRHDIIQTGKTDTKLYYKDGNKGEMIYYKAEVTVDEEARLFAQDIIPVISAYSQNSTTRLSTTINEFGVDVYLYNFNTSRWSLVADNTINSPGLLPSQAYNIRPVIANPSRFFSPDNKVHILIKPKHEIGYQINSTAEAGSNTLLINLIQLNGVF